MTIAIVQETRSERVLEALRDLTSPRALVIRGGVRRRIPGREVVRGDVIVLAEGDRVPADAMMISAQDLHIDESLLTGESVPVRKTAGRRRADRAVPAATIFPMSSPARWWCAATRSPRSRRPARGARSARSASALGTIETEPPLLRQQTRRLVRIFAGSASLSA